jgi:putative phosphoribosyl transferase
MFKDRKEAGEQLALALKNYRNQNPIILALPKGGLVVAYYVAKYLNAELSMVISRKLGYPFQPEAAFGAIAEDGSLYLTEEARIILSDEIIKEVIEKEKKEIKRRIELLRKNEPLPDINNRIVILVDDGIATGATLFAAIQLCKNKKAKKVIVAAPVSGEETIRQLENIVNEVVILEIPYVYYGVSQEYENFQNVTEEEVLEIMDQWEKEKSVAPATKSRS